MFLRLPARAGEPLVLSSFVQPNVLRAEGLRASFADTPLAAQVTVEAGFERWRIAAPPHAGTVLVEYTVRPGAEEQAKMAGPTGYRFGHLDAGFGLFAGRQIFLFPTEPRRPDRFRVVFILPSGWDLIAPWPRDRVDGHAGFADGPVATDGLVAADAPAAVTGGPAEKASVAAFRVEGAAASARLLRAVVGAGVFETVAAPAAAGGGAAAHPGFRVHVLSSLPAEVRKRVIGRALALKEFLAGRLGRPDRGYDLIFVPKAPTGSYVSVAPAPEGFGLSLGEGLPTRWLSIARALGRAYLGDRFEALAEDAPARRVLEALPTWLAVEYSQREGWRAAQVWLEQFYYNSAGLDLADASQARQPLVQEWRTAVALHHLSRAMTGAGLGSIEDALLEPRRRETLLAWSPFLRRLPDAIRGDLEGWLSPAPFAIPFPEEERAAPSRDLPPPPPIAAGAPGRRIDLYLGGRNLGLLEQCGCRSQQTGGMARRTTLLRRRLAGPTTAMALEIGDAVPFDQKSPLLDRQRVSEADLALSLLASAGTAGLNLSHAEIAYGPEFLKERAARLPRGFRLFSANVQVPGLDLPADLSIMPDLRRERGRRDGVRRGGPLLRIVGLLDPGNYHLGRALEYEDATAPIRITDPVEGTRRALAASQPSGTIGVAGYLSATTVLRIVRELPGLPLVITHDYFRFNEDRRVRFTRPLEGLSTFGMLDGTLVVLLQSDAYGLVRLGLLLRDDGGIAGAEIEDLVLEESIPDDPGVRKRLDLHYARLARESGLSDYPPVGALLAARLRASYVGAGTCASCHAAETGQWESTPHAAAFATLLARNRQGVPGCFACHVTGYGQQGGYRTVTDLGMRHVQCESCHGPGGRHVADPRRDTIVRTPPAVVCRECHNEKHSDMTEATYDDYRRRILHAPPPG